MNTPTPAPGRHVLYVLGETDVETINATRALSAATCPADKNHLAPARGNYVQAGDIYPAMLIRIWNPETGLANLQVFLDGTDSHWATSRELNSEKSPGTWHWPERV